MNTDKFENLEEIIEDVAFEHLLSEAAKRSLNRVKDHIQNRSVGFITANRGKKEDGITSVSKAENRSNNKALEKDIKDAGYGFVRVKGGWVETNSDKSKVAKREPSYLVVGPKHDDGGKLKEFLKHHGSKYNQDAVLYKGHTDPDIHEISTSNRREDLPKFEQRSLGKMHPGKFGDYFTGLHGDADTDTAPKKMTPEERFAHRQASLRKKTFVFESLQFEFSDDEVETVPVNDLTYYARLGESVTKKK